MLFDDIFNDFFTKSVYPEGVLKEVQEQKCSHCGMTLSEFNRIGRFGCEHCYEELGPGVKPLIQRVQNSLTYEGKIPHRGASALKVEQQLRHLRQQLQEAVAHEKFEEAAKLRDQIKELSAKV